MRWNQSVSIFIVLSFLLHEVYLTNGLKSQPKIAVVGAGIGGTATSHFLRQMFGDDLELDLYEARHVGGRLDTVTVGRKSYDSGGTLIHPRNMYMVNFTSILGLTQKKTVSEHIALYNGDNIVFDGSSWSWLLTAQMLWRYRWDVVKIDKFISGMLSKFDRIYQHQDAGFAFTTPEALLHSMSPDFIGYLERSMVDVLTQDAGVSDKIITELGNAAQRNNYGQTVTSTQGFVGAVSLAGIQPGLWRVEEGNDQVPERLVKEAKANLIKTKVLKVSLATSDPPTYHIVTDKGETTYDVVIIATPLHDKLSGITFENFPQAISDFPQHFHRTVATFVRGQPNFPNFGYKTFHDFPQNLLTISDGIFFNSMGKQIAVGADHLNSYKDKQELPVWKVFSQKPLTDAEKDKLFLSYEEEKIVDWMAYPHYSTNETSLPPFELHPQLYYINLIELCASAMEMSAIGARNVALLTYNKWNEKHGLVNPDFSKQKKEEL